VERVQGGADMLANPQDFKLLLEDLPPENLVYNTHLPDYEVGLSGLGLNKP